MSLRLRDPAELWPLTAPRAPRLSPSPHCTVCHPTRPQARAYRVPPRLSPSPCRTARPPSQKAAREG